MSSEYLENRIYQLLESHLEHRPFHLHRLAAVCTGVLLAGTTELSKVARWIRKPSQQSSRIQFLKRFLVSPYFNQAAAYYPLVRQALQGYKTPTWHLIMDRTTLIPHQRDLLMVSLSFRKRAIPLGWQLLDFGCTGSATQIELFQRIEGLIPANQAVVVHGDTEFGSVPLMRFIRKHPAWDFILAQTSHTYFQEPDGSWHYLGDVPVKPRQPVYRAQVRWTKEHQYGPVNLFAFYAPHQTGPTSPRYERRYCVTSLPITHTLRRLGRRRWGTEPMFRDYKSAGWHLDHSGLQDPEQTETLLVVLSINYLWTTSIGRWLCKSGLRCQVDAKKTSFQFISSWLGLAHSQPCHGPPDTYSANSLSVSSFPSFFRILLNGGETCNLQLATLLS
jgi:hypothetical protein